MKYHSTKNFWNNIFEGMSPAKYELADLGQQDLNEAAEWFQAGTESVLDFGCGSGTYLFDCALRGTKRHIGIDVSEAAIALARERAKLFGCGSFEFIQGSSDNLKAISDNSIDGAVLSNIVDNLLPEDAMTVLDNIHRILRPGGKIIFKVNPYLTEQQIAMWDIEKLENSLLHEKTGLYLWNLDTDKWCSILERYFDIYFTKNIYFEQHQQFNRLFLLINRNDSL